MTPNVLSAAGLGVGERNGDRSGPLPARKPSRFQWPQRDGRDAPTGDRPGSGVVNQGEIGWKRVKGANNDRRLAAKVDPAGDPARPRCRRADFRRQTRGAKLAYGKSPAFGKPAYGKTRYGKPSLA